MHLKKLELYGFKSFADRTVFNFDPGITSIVGPNGCGKSNIVDAFKWVLGTQSAKSLRGEEMLDVIFKGTDNRKPLGYAEVSLTFDNTDRVLPVDYEEVCVTRRLFRTGESEYLLNRQACRLKDVRELFLDTGVGTSTYSVIEQGRVTALLNASSQERRLVFEEAAGISKYKVKMKEALRRLERVENNLEVLGSVLGEVTKQLNAAKRQASKARRYLEIQEQLKDKQLILALSQYRDLKAAHDRAREALAAAEDRERAVAAEAGEIAAELTQLESERSDLARNVQRNETERAALQEEIHRIESEAKGLRVRAQSLREEAERLAAEAKKLADDTAVERERMQALENECAAARAETTARESALEARAFELDRRLAETRDAARAIDDHKLRQLEAVRERARHQSEAGRLRADLDARAAREQRLVEFLERKAAEIDTGKADLDQARARLNEVTANATAGERELERRKEELGRLEHEMGSRQETRRALEGRLSEARGRLAVVEGLEARREGVAAGARALTGPDAPPGTLGLLADALEVDARFAPAVESVLGEREQDVLVATRDDAYRALAWLNERRAGRAVVRPVDSAHPDAEGADKAILAHDGVIGRVSDLVRCDERYRRTVEALLGRAYVVRDDATALAMSSNGAAGRYTLVTPEGFVAGRRGELRGGRESVEAVGLIGRRSEMARLQNDVRMGAEVLAREGADLERMESKRAADVEEVRTGLRQIHEWREQRARLERDAETRAAALARMEDERRVTTFEVDEVRRERASAERALAACEAQAAELAAEEEKLVATVRELETAHGAAMTARASLESEVTGLKVALAEARERAGAVEARRTRSAEDLRRAEEALAARTAAVGDRKALETESLRDAETRESTLADRLAARDNAAARAAEDAGRLSEIDDRARALREADADVRRRSKEAQDALAQVRQETGERKQALQSMVERTQLTLSVDVAAEFESGRALAEITPELQAEIESLAGQLERMGPVNLYAVQELDQLEERHTFLNTQSEDLQRARRHLKDAVARINRKSRVLFEETFQKVRLNFQNLFRKLFHGGKADVTLEEGVDILEAGIEIRAQPPGKHVNRQQLSGGEQTMTTIALIFALFQNRASPFCILDEVDAPLDESNVVRFCLMVREFSKNTQFLVITHNKRTMSYAEGIYGVTMEESGVSKKLAIRFDDLREDGTLQEQAASA